MRERNRIVLDTLADTLYGRCSGLLSRAAGSDRASAALETIWRSGSGVWIAHEALVREVDDARTIPSHF